MKADKTAHGIDASSIPGDFRENYRFLSELINCEEKNSAAAKRLEQLAKSRFDPDVGALNRRQLKILKCYMTSLVDEDADPMSPPVPAELEASIRIRRRSSWLPWEAEAIRKIEKWRSDVLVMSEKTSGTPTLLTKNRQRSKRVKQVEAS